ncbi:MAG: diaminobutyrate--2-oxoglutarate transaminase [Pseudomonadota bacterium]|jgi:diaminobutyrate-2-oxoglutarate transaminase
MTKSDIGLFEEHEANVRSYCRHFPTVFASAQGATIYDEAGRGYIDFLAGAGTLNYGHNHPYIKDKVINYLQKNGIVHSLDLYTMAKHDFIESLYDTILTPRGLEYKITFPGPTGTNAVETACKFARRATGRETIVAFTNAFHGMTMGSLALTGNRSKREGAGVGMPAGVFRAPFDGYMGPDIDTSELLGKMLHDKSSGLDSPAAIIVETVQGEGGINAASKAWMQSIARLAKRHGALLIVDDIQAGCGRTGTFFSFEDMGIEPDIVCLSKSIGGMGLPMAIVLLKPELDVLKPGQHNGTFRGHNLAFVGAKAAIELWQDPAFEKQIKLTASVVRERLEYIVSKYPDHGAHVRGRGLMIGIGWDDTSIASRVSKAAYERQLIIETSGSSDQVLKLLPPLTMTEAEREKGLDVIEAAVGEVLASETVRNGRAVSTVAAMTA